MTGIVVIGASEGGVRALLKLTSGLPAGFPAPIVAVVHIGKGPSLLPSILNGAGGPQASHVEDGEPLRPGHIHVAPPDRHVLVVDGRLALSRGPRENWARPAIDPTMRTAAEAFGPQAIGVVLTGRLHDGSAGLYEIKRRGGIAVVQDPSDAEAFQMPQSAIGTVPVDFVLRLAEMPGVLMHLAEERKNITLQRAGSTGTIGRAVVTPSASTCPIGRASRRYGGS